MPNINASSNGIPKGYNILNNTATTQTHIHIYSETHDNAQCCSTIYIYIYGTAIYIACISHCRTLANKNPAIHKHNSAQLTFTEAVTVDVSL